MGAESWDNYAYTALIVFAFLIKDGKILLIKRANEPYKGEVTIPGGRKKRAESLREAVVREMYEETGYTLKSVSFAGVLHAAKDGDDKEYVSHYFVCSDFGGELRESDEGGLMWADIDTSTNIGGIHPFYQYLLPRVLKNAPFDVFVHIKPDGSCEYSG